MPEPGRKVCYLQALLKGREDVTSSVGLLISILVRYPEVAAINFDPWEQSLKFSFICSRKISEEEMRRFENLVRDHVRVYNYLKEKDASIVEIKHQVFEDLTIIEVKRDVGTLAQDEIALVVEIFHRCWGKDLVSDLDDENIIEEDMVIQEEIIEHMLESVRGSAGYKKLYAFREEGKVLVFNK